MLVPRIITATILGIAVIWGVFALPIETFSIAGFLVMVLALYEWTQLCGGSIAKFALSAALLSLLCWVFIGFEFFNPAYLLGLALLFWLYKLVNLSRLGDQSVSFRVACQLDAVITLFLAWVGLVMLKAHTGTEGVLLMLAMLVVWSADTFAYFGGKRYGKTKLAPAISPGKTWEGVLAGTLGAVIIAVIYSALFIEQVNSLMAYSALILIVVFVALISVVGDLSESKLKRAVGAKDSGKLLPGHGGILDRIDGLIAGLPIFAFYWMLLTQLGVLA